MENLTCKGLSAAHRRMLIKCITEERLAAFLNRWKSSSWSPFDGNSIHRYGAAARSRHSGSRLRF